jgi:putative Holliday junction resolvase
MHWDGNPAQIAPQVNAFVAKIKELFPRILVVMQDERFTSEDAKKIILQSGAKKKKRQDKALVDKISAVLILQEYLEKTRYQD